MHSSETVIQSYLQFYYIKQIKVNYVLDDLSPRSVLVSQTRRFASCLARNVAKNFFMIADVNFIFFI